MKIGIKIKKRRTELGMTQESLAQQLNVSRSTVSNWEIDRNYPDIASIVDISDFLGLSLDELLKEDEEMKQRLSKDTEERKRLSKKVRVMYIIVLLLVILAAGLLIRTENNKDISDPAQIKSVSVSKNVLHIETDLPPYRKVSGYFMNKDADSLQVAISTHFSLGGNDSLDIDLEEYNAENIIKIEFIDEQGVYKTEMLNK